ncbi:uncharacterized protein LOC119173554 [Rhipicephalus microplus]|uniref:uncharacterized protein LOC119173554 n=1 Tax=Rhipicephalus microplus TaxID=6941 RepID=UPI003F6A6322
MRRPKAATATPYFSIQQGRLESADESSKDFHFVKWSIITMRWTEAGTARIEASQKLLELDSGRRRPEACTTSIASTRRSIESLQCCLKPCGKRSNAGQRKRSS